MRTTILFAIFAMFMTACSERGPAPAESTSTGKPGVVASNYPLFFFATEIAGEHIEVSFPRIVGDPAMWAPGGPDIAELQDADLLLLNGAGYESWLAFTTLPDGHNLDTTAQLQGRLLPIENETVHQHGPAGEHSHQGTAFTTWLDPLLAIEQARSITQGLSALEPDHADVFESNFETLKRRLTQLDQSMQKALAPLAGQAVVFSHPVYQYLQHRYGINGRSMHWEPDMEPGTRDWIDFGKLLREHPARIMIWENTPLDSVRDKLRQIGVEVIVFRPAGNTPEQGDYFAVMQQNVFELETVAN